MSGVPGEDKQNSDMSDKTRRMKTKRGNGKKGFTLVEAIVSVAVFSIAAVLFAMILFNATHMVNLSLVYDRDRIALTQAIETGFMGSITVTTKEDGDTGYEQMTIDLSKISKKYSDERGVYYIYRAPSGREYCLYVGSADGMQEI